MNTPAIATTADLTPEEQAFLDRVLPIRALIGWAPGANAPVALIEHSFSMDFSPDRALIFWSGTAHSILGTLTLNAEEEVADQLEHYRKAKPDWRFEVIDPMTPDCPVLIDLKQWIRANLFGSIKFNKRNAHFTMADADAGAMERATASVS